MLWMHPLRLGVLLLCVGCGSALTQATAEFEAGRAPEAMRRLRAIEPELARLSRNEQLRYGLYRGLSYLSLGDLERSRDWILPVKHALDHDPRLFSDSERGRLLSALRSLGHMPGE
jgi:hypothetical protein